MLDAGEQLTWALHCSLPNLAQSQGQQLGSQEPDSQIRICIVTCTPNDPVPSDLQTAQMAIPESGFSLESPGWL